MNKTKIEWCDYTINPIKGLCKGDCWYCYARQMYKRFKWDKKVKFMPEELDKIKLIKEPSRIFLCSTHDLFGSWIPDKWIYKIITECQRYPQHTFLLLTKNPNRYRDWTFRDNFWLGQTIADNKTMLSLPRIGERNKTFISFEPLIEEVNTYLISIDWVIIGALTGPKSQIYHPKPWWIESLVKRADNHNIPVFLKNNLKPYYMGELRQEFPK